MLNDGHTRFKKSVVIEKVLADERDITGEIKGDYHSVNKWKAMLLLSG